MGFNVSTRLVEEALLSPGIENIKTKVGQTDLVLGLSGFPAI